MKFRFIFISVIGWGLFGCSNKSHVFDAAGNFEAIETVISAEANGKIMAFDIT